MSVCVLTEVVPAVVVDMDGKVRDVNAAAGQLLGDSIINLINKPWDRPLNDGAMLDLGGHSVQLAIMKTTQANYVTLIDLSAKKQQRQQAAEQALEIVTLQNDLKKAQELMAVKEKFTALIAHDFGAPITGIRLQSEILKKQISVLSDEAITQRLEQVDAQLVHMIDLLDDLLLLNQIHTPHVNDASSSFHLEAFARKIIDQIKRGWKGREVLITFTGEHDQVQVDRRLIRYILSNLVGNALKYSPKGGDVTVDIRITDEAIALSVSDQGIGIPADELGKISTQFYRATNANEFSGLGLGLTTMRTCIEMYEGTIEVTSKLNVGTTFEVSLPRCTD